MSSKNIVVVGSSNTDLVVETSTFPKPGETIMGGAFNTFAGGKGANQAVAASRLGGAVTFIAKIGNDDFGETALKGFKKDKINTDFVFIDEDNPSGVAIIMVDDSGENIIVVSPGANNALNSTEIEKAHKAFDNADMVLVQLETPLETVKRALELAREKHKQVILNPAPAQSLDDSFYPLINIITPNETEAEILTGIKVDDDLSACQAANVLLKKGVTNVVITMGERGAYFKNKEEEFLVSALKVNAIDTTGAGDTFNGALAVALAEGQSWREAITFGNKAASLSVGKMGAQASIPGRDQLKK